MELRKAIRAAAALAIVTSLAAPLSAAELKLGLTNNPGDPAYEASTRLADLVRERTEGRVDIKVFGRSELGNNRQLFDQVISGATEMAVTPYGVLADVVPEYTATLGGFFYEDWEELQSVLQSEEFGKAWDQQLVERSGLRLLGSWFQGARHVTMTDLAPRSPSDFAGVKLRAVPNPISLATVSGMGANPTPVPFPELFGALRQGIVDGQENPMGTISSSKLYEVQKYLIKTAHQLQALPWLVNEQVWNGLDEADQQIILETAAEVAEWANDLTIELETSLETELAANGMEIIELTDDEVATFRDAVRKSTREEFDGSIWPEGMMDAVLALVD